MIPFLFSLFRSACRRGEGFVYMLDGGKLKKIRVNGLKQILALHSMCRAFGELTFVGVV